MKYLTTSTSPQDLHIIPREYRDPDKITLVDDSTKEETIILSPLTFIEGNYLRIHTSFNLKEGRFYDFKVHLRNDIIYRGKISCSDNNNASDYISVDSNNDFIIL